MQILLQILNPVTDAETLTPELGRGKKNPLFYPHLVDKGGRPIGERGGGADVDNFSF